MCELTLSATAGGAYGHAMPYWSIYCLHCHGYIVDALLECLPAAKRSNPAYQQLFHARPGAALACPYCSGLIGFDDAGQAQLPHTGWPVFRYGRAELELKKQADGEPPNTSLAQWAMRHRFTQPGTHDPLSEYSLRNKHPLMKLSPEEELFLSRWMYDEAHYQEGQGPAKALQIRHRAISADLAVIVAAAIPDQERQAAIGLGPPPEEALKWPWSSEHTLHARASEARAILGSPQDRVGAHRGAAEEHSATS